MPDSSSLDSATLDIATSHAVEEGLLSWFQSDWAANPQPLAADVWVFSPDFRQLLVVEHRWRGLVPPGGRVELGETPRDAAAKELREETGLSLQLAERAAFAAARSYHSDWPATLNLSYWAIAEVDSALTPEDGQPARWVNVESDWRTFHPYDAATIAKPTAYAWRERRQSARLRPAEHAATSARHA